jgi:hypothetical protein
MSHVNVSWNWSWSQLAPEVIRYTLPETLHCWVVDRQPEVLNRAFAMGFLIAFTTFQAEGTLADYPEFGRRVSELAALRKKCASLTSHARFMDGEGLRVEGGLAYVYKGKTGLGVVFAEALGREGDVRAVLDPSSHGAKAVDGGELHFQDGRSKPAGRLRGDGQVEIKFRLPALEVAIWTVPRRTE